MIGIDVKRHRCLRRWSSALTQLAQVGGQHWTIEQDFQAAEGECGLDEYETRGWVGWHHHTALSMLALLFLVLQRQRLVKKEELQMTVPEVRAVLRHLPDRRQAERRRPSRK